MGAHVNIEDVRWKHEGTQVFSIWAKVQHYSQVSPFVDFFGGALGGWIPENTNTGSTSAPASSTAFSVWEYKQIGGTNTIQYTASDTYFLENIRMANGKGIDFSATANAGNSASMTNELLDDYEEGTFTPTNSIGMTLTNNNTAFYTKIGRMVHIQLDISFATAPNDTAQCGMIQSLPFTSDGTSGHDNTLGQQYISKSSTTGDSDYAKKFDYDDEGTRLVIEDGESRIDIYNNVGNYRRSRGWLCGRRIRISAWYKTAT